MSYKPTIRNPLVKAQRNPIVEGVKSSIATTKTYPKYFNMNFTVDSGVTIARTPAVVMINQGTTSKVVGSSGGLSPSDYGFPVYQNGMRGSRGFMTIANATINTTLDTNGWPNTDFQTYLMETQGYSSQPSWAHVNDSAKPWKCGFTSKNGGTETITGATATISNKVVAGNLVTFDLVPTGGACGFSITGTTGGATNVFANLPEYPTAAGLFTAEYLSLVSKFGLQRGLDWSNVLWNDTVNSWATRNSAANTHAPRWATGVLASTVATATGEGSPVDDFVSLCNATSSDLWYHLPINDDGTYVTGLASYLFANLTSTLNVRVELGNELWNGVGVGGGVYAWVVAKFIAANSGNLDWDGALSFSGTANGTTTVTGVVPAGVNSGLTIAGPNVPSGTYITAVTAGVSITLNNSIPAGTGTFAAASFTALHRYYAYRMYLAYQAFSSAFGGSYSTRVKLVGAWQTGAISAFVDMAAYLVHYYPGTPVRTILGAFSSAPYQTRDNSLILSDGVNHTNHAGDSIATIQAQLTLNGQYRGMLSAGENTALTAMHYGMALEAYECGWEIGGETAAANYGPAIMDSGMASVASGHLQGLLNSGYSRVNWTAFGLSNTNTATVDPGYALSKDYSALVSTGSPRLSGIAAVNASGPTYTRNVVSASGSVIDCINYADNALGLSVTYPYLGQLNGYAQGPYYSFGGYIGYLINCTVPGTYSVQGTFTTTSTGTTSLEWGNPSSAGTGNITTGIAIPNGSGGNVTVTLGNVTLVKGPNYVLLGNGTTYSGVVPKSLKFN